jgi:hypothetical protein
MRYLARIYHNTVSNTAHLKLLAQEEPHSWKVLNPLDREVSLPEVPEDVGTIVLAELSGDQVIKLEDATHWILDLVQNYLAVGVTPASLREEAERAEKWLQDLTLQSQDLTRRALEMEARLKQVQDMEEKISKEHKALDQNKGGSSL